MTDTLIERLEKAMPFADYYLVTDDGDVWSKKSNRFLRKQKCPKGYYRFSIILNGLPKEMRANRLVCEAFHGPPPTPKSEARHLNGSRGDNRASNLAWGSRSENAKDSVRHGTCSAARNSRKSANKRAGELSPVSKLTWPDVLKIREMRVNGASYPEIASRFNIDQSNAHLICARKTWKGPMETRPSKQGVSND